MNGRFFLAIIAVSGAPFQRTSAQTLCLTGISLNHFMVEKDGAPGLISLLCFVVDRE